MNKAAPEVGGAETLPQSIRALREGGDIAGIGLLAGTPVWEVASQSACIQRIRVGSRADFEDTLRGIVAARIRPVVDTVFPVERLADAFQSLHTGRMFGKIGIAFH